MNTLPKVSGQIVLAALQSTFQPTVALLRQIASDARRSIDVAEVLCGRAWRLFELGDHTGYAGEIAKTIEATALPGDVVLLAQASMAPAAELVRHLEIPVLSSSQSGVDAAVSRYRSRTQHDAAQLHVAPAPSSRAETAVGVGPTRDRRSR